VIFQAIVFLLVDSLLVISGLPQGGYSSSGSAQGGSCCGGANGGGQELQGSAASFGQGSFASNQAQGFGGSGGGGGNNLNVECQRQEVSPGRYKFICEGVNKDAISLRSEHVLWLTQNGGEPQIVDIEVPNYKIEELIKAGFKAGASDGSTINVLLKRPETTVDAQVDVPSVAGGPPKVNLQYEAVDKKLVHFPNDQAYSPLQGPILPPLAGGRPQRQVQKNFSKPYSSVANAATAGHSARN
jgi:hypothetical protein